MRLTLRTLLAYLDDILEPADAELLAEKIENNPNASELAHRIRESLAKRRMPSPAVHGTGGAADANAVSEYLDNTLPVERMPDFERTCLESDIHLSEVASCHQILTMVLGEPAEVTDSLRHRAYELGGEASQANQRLDNGVSTTASNTNTRTEGNDSSSSGGKFHRVDNAETTATSSIPPGPYEQAVESNAVAPPPVQHESTHETYYDDYASGSSRGAIIYPIALVLLAGFLITTAALTGWNWYKSVRVAANSNPEVGAATGQDGLGQNQLGQNEIAPVHEFGPPIIDDTHQSSSSDNSSHLTDSDSKPSDTVFPLDPIEPLIATAPETNSTASNLGANSALPLPTIPLQSNAPAATDLPTAEAATDLPAIDPPTALIPDSQIAQTDNSASNMEIASPAISPPPLILPKAASLEVAPGATPPVTPTPNTSREQVADNQAADAIGLPRLPTTNDDAIGNQAPLMAVADAGKPIADSVTPESLPEKMPAAISGNDGSAATNGSESNAANDTNSDLVTDNASTDAATDETTDATTEEPEPAQDVARSIVEDQALAIWNNEKQAWTRLGLREPLRVGQRFRNLPAFRPQLLLVGGLRMTLVGNADFSLGEPTGVDTPNVSFAHGRARFMGMGQAPSRVKLEVAGRTLTIQQGEPNSEFAVEVLRTRTPGSDPTTAPRHHVVHVWPLSGRIGISEGDGEEESDSQAVEAGQVWFGVDQREATIAKSETLPGWVTESKQRPIDRNALLELEPLLVEDRSLTLSLLEAAKHKRTDISSLAARCLASLGRYEPLIQSLGNRKQHPHWQIHVQQLRTAVDQHPESYALVAQALRRVTGPDANKLLTLLASYSPLQLADGGTEQMINDLESESLEVRVVAIESLRHITGRTEWYDAYRPAIYRRPKVQQWRRRLSEGEVLYDNPPLIFSGDEEK